MCVLLFSPLVAMLFFRHKATAGRNSMGVLFADTSRELASVPAAVFPSGGVVFPAQGYCGGETIGVFCRHE